MKKSTRSGIRALASGELLLIQVLSSRTADSNFVFSVCLMSILILLLYIRSTRWHFHMFLSYAVLSNSSNCVKHVNWITAFQMEFGLPIFTVFAVVEFFLKCAPRSISISKWVKENLLLQILYFRGIPCLYKLLPWCSNIGPELNCSWLTSGLSVDHMHTN